ncbi:putative leucine-rich repeat receptor-like protein kinase [Heracleum sosnowskyi]|uniref:non-specific serine/threonine protein kinase n=1 Tax=Heracleum sosnowskyi TaxID=360622 RepID=A0AAD8HQI9_9APIA|nr:putative leucine-rich repeat receptor-like protein kinase [Heracleum sosnowskyi]
MKDSTAILLYGQKANVWWLDLFIIGDIEKLSSHALKIELCCQLRFRIVLLSVMDHNIQICALVFAIQLLGIASQDVAVLNALKIEWKNTPLNWLGSDPCGDNWEGITCNNSHVTSITLSSIGLTGQLPGDIANLPELESLDLSSNKGLANSLPPSIGKLKKLSTLILSGCSFKGSIPDTIGSLVQLHTLSLNNNQFSGRIPPSIGNLINLYWLDLADNQLTGTIPVSTRSSPGLDNLVNTKHFHLGKNQLSGEIPSQLFNPNLTVQHLLFESNKLSGSIPSTLGLVNTLVVVRIDNNSLSGSVPLNLNNLAYVTHLFLSNNKLTGPFPNLTGMSYLNNVDLSNNSFTASAIPPWFSTLHSLEILNMENTGLQGEVPTSLFSAKLQTVILKNNLLTGTLDLGSSNIDKLQVVDLKNNSINGFKPAPGYINELILVDNPICQGSGGRETQKYCTNSEPLDPSHSTEQNKCAHMPCSSYQVSSPKCKCTYPFTCTLFFRVLSNPNSTIYTSIETSLMSEFQSIQLPVDSIFIFDSSIDVYKYFALRLEIFPTDTDRFNLTEITRIAFVFSNQSYKPDVTYGPYIFIGDSYNYFPGHGYHKSSSTGIIVGAGVGGCVLVLLLLISGLYAYRQKRRAERADKQINPFASWDPNQSSGGIPQLKGARNFSFEEIRKYTNKFSEVNIIGSGGYGMVYRGTLPSGLLVAVKRAQQGSTQGGLEFKTEIELLSRVHHKNVVSLVGFCFDQSEQMLIYEYIPNGTLKDSLLGKCGIRLDWMRRLRIALGAARGIQYLHDLADPPIIHRDIKSNNILLDERLNAKVADFGLSKPMGDMDKGHVTTQVKGTLGYLDPEYYMTQQLTEKSDVYSFGVVLLELLTARNPIEKGMYIVREFKLWMDTTKKLYNLQGIIDPVISGDELIGFERFVDLALSCVKESGVNRPSMSDVVKEIENIMELAGLNPNAESTQTSENYQGISKGFDHPYTNESLFNYSGSYLLSKLDPK